MVQSNRLFSAWTELCDLCVNIDGTQKTSKIKMVTCMSRGDQYCKIAKVFCPFFSKNNLQCTSCFNVDTDKKCKLLKKQIIIQTVIDDDPAVDVLAVKGDYKYDEQVIITPPKGEGE